MDVATSRRAVRAVGAVALVTSDVAGIVDRWLFLLDLGSDYVACEALGQVGTLRVAPDRADVCITAISASARLPGHGAPGQGVAFIHWAGAGHILAKALCIRALPPLPARGAQP
jgi:hypothetical protein